MWTLTTGKDWASLREQFEWVREMEDVPQDPVHHAEGNVAIHTRMVLEALQQLEGYKNLPAQDQEVLWAAALLHDVEKRSTTVHEADGSITSRGPRKHSGFPPPACGMKRRSIPICATASSMTSSSPSPRSMPM